jgi:hypothetical protein
VSIFRFSNAGGFGTYQRYNDFLAGNPAVVQDAGAMFPLGEFTLASTQATVEFTNIPQTYRNLQIRGIMRNNDSVNASTMIQVNSDTGNNYANHGLSGDGASASSYAVTSTNSGALSISTISGSGSNTFGVAIYDLLEYKNTNTYKTIRCLTGADNNGSGTLRLTSGVWQNTNAITSIQIKPTAGSWVANTQFALYGVL